MEIESKVLERILAALERIETLLERRRLFPYTPPMRRPVEPWYRNEITCGEQ